MNFCGIDPGIEGAVAILDSSGTVIALFDLMARKKEISALEISLQLVRLNPATDSVLIEDFIAHGMTGRKQAFSMGRGVGMIEGILVKMGFRSGRRFDGAAKEGLFFKIEPGVWQRELLGRNRKNTKLKSVNFAKNRFPEGDHLIQRGGKYDHNLCDALCIAEFFRRKTNDEDI